MRALERFRLKKKMNRSELQRFLAENGLEVSATAVYCWCNDKKHRKGIKPRYAIKLSEITGIEMKDFYIENP